MYNSVFIPAVVATVTGSIDRSEFVDANACKIFKFMLNVEISEFDSIAGYMEDDSGAQRKLSVSLSMLCTISDQTC